jgi:hypothetical protein
MTMWESKTFIRQAEELMSAGENSALKFYLGLWPEAGDLMPGTGGARKLRWAVGRQGKRGGVRVVYYFGGEDEPLVLFSVYKKGRKDNLSRNEKSELRAVIKSIRDQYRKKHQ